MCNIANQHLCKQATRGASIVRCYIQCIYTLHTYVAGDLDEPQLLAWIPAASRERLVFCKLYQRGWGQYVRGERLSPGWNMRGLCRGPCTILNGKFRERCTFTFLGHCVELINIKSSPSQPPELVGYERTHIFEWKSRDQFCNAPSSQR